MRLDGVVRDVELVCDLRLREPGREETENHQLALAQVLAGGRVLADAGPETPLGVVEERAHDSGVAQMLHLSPRLADRVVGALAVPERVPGTPEEDERVHVPDGGATALAELGADQDLTLGIPECAPGAEGDPESQVPQTCRQDAAEA